MSENVEKTFNSSDFSDKFEDRFQADRRVKRNIVFAINLGQSFEQSSILFRRCIILLDPGQAEISHEKDCAERYELPEERGGYIMEATGNGAKV